MTDYLRESVSTRERARIEAAAVAALIPPGSVLVTEETLAAALASTEVGCWANPPHHEPAQDDEVHRRDAAAILAALREPS